MEESNIIIVENEYNELLRHAVAVIDTARTNIARQVSATASNTYWEIGKLLHERKLDSKHGSAVIKRLSVDLKERYPDMGTSPRQLWNMKAFYERYKDSDQKLLRCVALLPWKHNLLMINKNLDDDAVAYYAQEDMGKPIGVADYQLLIPKEELQKTISDEIKIFEEEKKNEQ